MNVFLYFRPPVPLMLLCYWVPIEVLSAILELKNKGSNIKDALPLGMETWSSRSKGLV